MEQQIIELKNRIDSLEKERERMIGKRQALIDELKKLGYNSPFEAEKALEKLQQEKEEVEKKLQKDFEELERKVSEIEGMVK